MGCGLSSIFLIKGVLFFGHSLTCHYDNPLMISWRFLVWFLIIGAFSIFRICFSGLLGEWHVLNLAGGNTLLYIEIVTTHGVVVSFDYAVFFNSPQRRNLWISQIYGVCGGNFRKLCLCFPCFVVSVSGVSTWFHSRSCILLDWLSCY